MGVLRRPRTGRVLEVEGRIRAAIEAMRPILGIDPCALELLAFREDSGTAVLRVDGSCPHCAMSVTVFMQGIEANLRGRVPEVRAVEAVSGDPRHPGNDR